MLFKRIADNREDDSLATRMRRQRFAFFLDLLSTVPRPLAILDIGGTQRYWQRMGFVDEPGVRITLLNIQPQVAEHEGFEAVVGDATDLSGFADKAFDVVFSNSVIEHVGSQEQQRRMANEVMRVGRRYFVQTPNYFFPIEPHFLFPGFQWLPVSTRVWLITHFNLGWSKKLTDKGAARDLIDHTRLLREGEFVRLFPQAHLYREKALGMTKSLILYEGW